jgi:hypothetical protein
MQHAWRPDVTRAAQGIETCARPGCVAERRPNTGAEGRTRHYVHRPNGSAEWQHENTPRCTGGSMARPRARDRFKSSE